MVRLLQLDEEKQYCDLSCFNPTMLRLLRLFCGFCDFGDFVFQSHNGAIAALLVLFLWLFERQVSIPQWCDCCIGSTYTVFLTRCFNPTMVRLLRNRPKIEPNPAKRFNPTMVRLLRLANSITLMI